MLFRSDKMKDYLTIGEVAKLTRLPISTLRYYDSEGIVKPYHKDKNTQYRYYKIYQVSILKMVIHLKKLGFNNKYIKEHLQNLDYSYTRKLMDEMVVKTQKEIERLYQLKRELIENAKQLEYLSRLESEVDSFFEEEMEIDAIYANVDKDDLWNGIVEAFQELDNFLYHEKEKFVPLGFYGFTIKKEDILIEKYSYDKLLAFKKFENYRNRYIVEKKRYVCLVCQGKFEEMGKNMKKLLSYIEMKNYIIDGDGIINIVSGAEFQKNPFEAIYILKIPVK